MCDILLIGNPNVGKTTLFNSLTKSDEHTGNFHGVTTEEKSKTIKFDGKLYNFVDLPGIYSLNTFSFEEEVSRDAIIKDGGIKLVVADANSLRRNLYLCLQMGELNINYKLLINNYNYFLSRGNKLDIDELAKQLNTEVNVINAKKTKLTNSLLTSNQQTFNFDYLNPILDEIKAKYNLTKKQILCALNGLKTDLTVEEMEFIKTFQERVVCARYQHIDKLLADCIKTTNKYAYGESKLDKVLLNPFVMTLGFLAVFFASLYLIFFLVGPLISDCLIFVLNKLLISPINNFVTLTTDNIWLIEFISSGVFGAINTILAFLPQVVLLFVFLTILEDSGIIARMCYVFDDFLSFCGLNGKAVYTMLMGLGCNTMSTMASRNMNTKNLKIKTAILNPYISCMARLPVFVLVATAFFGVKSYFVVAGLYLLGLLVAGVMAVVLNKTFLKTESNTLLLEFPPLKFVDFKHIFVVAKKNCVDFLKRVFGVVVSVSIIVWILTHTKFNLVYTDTITNSVLFVLSSKISFIFKPLGLNSAGVVCALIVGVLAKELIVSTFAICNHTQSNAMLISSLACAGSVINFTLPSAVAFLVFSLLYCPCASNLAVLKKETSKFYMWFSVVSQFTIAYLLSWLIYTALTKGIWISLFAFIIVFVILFACVYLLKKLKSKKCLMCGKCKF